MNAHGRMDAVVEISSIADVDDACAAWDAALGLPVRKVTIDDLQYLAFCGLVKPRFRGGKYIGSRQNPDNSALLRLVARFDFLREEM